MTFSTWSQTAASNTSVGGISTDGTVTLVKQIDNMFRGMMAELAVARDDGTIDATAVRGYLHGLTLSNNAGDATNDIDIAVGECATSDSPYWKMALASALTKRLDAAWAVGTNQGGRMSAAAIADTTYHVWLIQRSDTGVVDVGFDVSATSPTMPANYDRKRRIGSILRESAAIVSFTQIGDAFMRTTPPILVSILITSASVLRGFSVPTGIVCAPILEWTIATASGGIANCSLGSTFSGSANVLVSSVGATGIVQRNSVVIPPVFFTNTSSQLYHAQSVTGTIVLSDISGLGWVDTRGRI